MISSSQAKGNPKPHRSRQMPTDPLRRSLRRSLTPALVTLNTMSLAPSANSPGSSIPAIYQLFAALASHAQPDGQSSLGGKLLYAGDISPASQTLLYAANIAGAASLAASPNPATQRQAMRDGVVDFLVTSLEEALRILKNEIRKHQTVSVCVTVAPNTLLEQMLDRGVLPDLLPATGLSPGDLEKFLAQGTRQIGSPPRIDADFIAWTVDANPVRWLPRIDACAQAILPAEDHLRQRWLRLAPRYLGRLAQWRHGVALTVQESAQLQAEVERMFARHNAESGEIVRATILDPER